MRGETAYINGDGSAARAYHVDNVVQMNLRAAMTDAEDALDQAYNVAHGEMTCSPSSSTSSARCSAEAPAASQEVCARYREPRRGDILLSRGHRKGATPSRLRAPMRIVDGLESTMDWYIANLRCAGERVANV